MARTTLELPEQRINHLQPKIIYYRSWNLCKQDGYCLGDLEPWPDQVKVLSWQAAWSHVGKDTWWDGEDDWQTSGRHHATMACWTHSLPHSWHLHLHVYCWWRGCWSRLHRNMVLYIQLHKNKPTDACSQPLELDITRHPALKVLEHHTTVHEKATIKIWNFSIVNSINIKKESVEFWQCFKESKS